MIVAFIASVSVFPALVALLQSGRGARRGGLAALAPLDRFLLRRRRAVLAAAGLVAVGSVALLPRLHFDFNPLHLRSAKAESVATLLDLMRDPQTTPNTVDVLTPTLADADAMAKRLAALPEVDARRYFLHSFMPAPRTTNSR